MLPVFAQSSSNELVWLSQDAVSVKFFEKNAGILYVEWEVFPLTESFIYTWVPINQPKNRFYVLSGFSLGRFTWMP